MWHPLESLSQSTLWWLLLFLGAAMVILGVRLRSLERRLRTSASPSGMLSLQMCLAASESESIIDSWDELAREDARRHLVLDYFYIPVYATAFAILGVLSARSFAAKGFDAMASLSIWLAWGQWIAGLFDFTENSALLRIMDLYPDVPDGLARLAGWSARIKFLLIMAAILLSVLALLTSVT